MQGNLSDMGVADLIQHACQDGRQVRLTLDRQGREGEIYFQNGRVVHAVSGDLTGEAAVFALLDWDAGLFRLDPDVAAPGQTIDRSHTALLLEGARLLDERQSLGSAGDEARGAPPGPSMEGEMSAVVEALGKVEGVGGVVLVAGDGVVLAHQVQGDPEKEGAVAAFVGAAAEQVGEAMSLGELKRAVATLGGGSILVLKHSEYFAGLMLAENASPAMVAAKAETALKDLA